MLGLCCVCFRVSAGSTVEQERAKRVLGEGGESEEVIAIELARKRARAWSTWGATHAQTRLSRATRRARPALPSLVPPDRLLPQAQPIVPRRFSSSRRINVYSTGEVTPFRSIHVDGSAALPGQLNLHRHLGPAASRCRVTLRGCQLCASRIERLGAPSESCKIDRRPDTTAAPCPHPSTKPGAVMP